MSNKVTDKKKARTFSLTDSEFAKIEAGFKRHGYHDRNEYLLALLEAEKALGLDAILDPQTRAHVLRINPRASVSLSQGKKNSQRDLKSGAD